MRSLKMLTLAGMMLVAMFVTARPAQALAINPGTGLVDFVFDFPGFPGSASFGGDANLTILLGGSGTLSVHVEDCCVDTDSFALRVDGVLTPWTVLEHDGGDGIPNGAAVMGPGGTYFEAIATFVLGAGLHTIDLDQTEGIPGGAYINVSPVPEPAMLLLVGGGLAAFARRRARSRS